MKYSRPYQLDVSWMTGELSLDPFDLAGLRGEHFALAAPFEFLLTLSPGVTIPVTISRGFVTDGASIPWMFQGLVPRSARTWPPAIIHDLLYGARGWEIISKGRSDAVFGLALAKQELPPWRIAAMFEAVKWGGGGCMPYHTPNFHTHKN